ncbi:hypothetical protein PGTUg99_007470 [Puccinia graminis f. sp. tritici]|uniref:Uncharacterized protein n=1 Tax=Puccinia graminis f. sp. tritici TaxID=56615 RepID=A0A5B0N996_PUCGR|nr:hypothetical protein PGTUg99_007470 [Puccinia graminis f. sp. tritici]
MVGWLGGGGGCRATIGLDCSLRHRSTSTSTVVQAWSISATRRRYAKATPSIEGVSWENTSLDPQPTVQINALIRASS